MKRIIEKELNKRNQLYKRKLRNNPTGAETIIKRELRKIKIKFQFQKGFFKLTGKLAGFHCIVDFYIKALKLVIEVDGGYHNNQKWKDKLRDEWLMKVRNVNVLRIKNEDAKNILAIINEFMKNPPIRKNVNFNYWFEKYKLL